MDLLQKARTTAAAAVAAATEELSSSTTNNESPRTLIRNYAQSAPATPQGDTQDADAAPADEAQSELEVWKKRASSLEARMKAATEARKAWNLQEAELKNAM